MPAPVMTEELVKKMLTSAWDAARWAKQWGLTHGYEVLTHLSMYQKQFAEGTEMHRIIGAAMKRIDTVRKVAPVVQAAGARFVLSAGARTAIMWGIGGVVVLALLYGGYLIYLNSQTYRNIDSLGDPEGEDETHAKAPLTGDQEFTDPIKGPPPDPARVEAIRKGAKRELIRGPSGVGEDDTVVIEAGGYTGVSGGRVTPEYMARLQKWEKQVNDAVDQIYHQGGFDGFNDSYVNLLKWKPYPAVVKAELKQSGRKVTGHLWLNIGDDPKGFKTKKVAITKSRASGERGKEAVELELANGEIKGTLYLMDKGATIEGELNGVYVVVVGSRVSDARAAIEKQIPKPKQ